MSIEVVKIDYVNEESGEVLEYEIQPMPAFKALTLKAKLFKILAPGLDGWRDSETLEDVDFSALAQGIMSNIDPEKLPHLLLEILHNIVRDGEKISSQTVFNKVYTNNYYEMIWIVGQVLKINYESFLPALGKLKDTAKGKNKSK